MNPRLKHIAHLPTVECGDDSSAAHVHVCEKPSREGSPTFTDTSSVQDEAALLLSIASICDREVKSSGFNAIFDDEFPRFPMLSLPGPVGSSHDLSALKPRSEPLFNHRAEVEKPCFQSFQALRARTVSIDSPALATAMEIDRTSSPFSLAPETAQEPPALVSPITPLSKAHTLPPRKQSLRRAKQNKNKIQELEEPEEEPQAPVLSCKDKKGRTLQTSPPKGVPIKMIGRKKFSWKCYPELEQFLVLNREEYLRHSALNYTIQQKQYNNRLTDQLLDLATKHGYLFDTQEFSFVTVRDRIRCYYKSYVQSAKKRGVLMGYAARKAGLLKEEDLVGNGGRIVTNS
mmetsp:Transcript_7209/g.9363  ORF Transcript_7209/g.9363 Transcript_7209/m.9363 type:complete len:345 (+) Transcript_7209:130-1164(+)|eukprot:CAMPEP_0198146712 /NCGR_PEP_ID=MMETSP1443-20131203/30991_1 /TAXON_ID=186043 /ORGANISM="Entomoneis sp., Strain CCMP2396" /LENGTH=344 /DNA_ID=CAMNT_0043810765 /DNA_START=59 /DNA_END=1093 /DNA_ORIENTATION=-